MTLIELHADVGRVADALEKLVFLLEKLVFPPPPADVKVHQAQLDDLRTVSEEDILRMKDEENELAQRYNVVPGSAAHSQAILTDWEEQQRSIHGPGWKPPDWQAIMAQAHRSSEQGRAEDAAAQTADRI